TGLPPPNEHIDRLLAHLPLDKIRAWRQLIEDAEAAVTGRQAMGITTEMAFRDFREALELDPLSPEISEQDHALSESARALLSDLNRTPRRLSLLTLVDAWRVAANPPANPTPEEKAYLDFLDQQENRTKARG